MTEQLNLPESTPQFRHHGCERCVFLGRFDLKVFGGATGPQTQHLDLYFCDLSGADVPGRLRSVTARWGSRPTEFHTEVLPLAEHRSHHASIEEAKFRARRKGLFT